MLGGLRFETAFKHFRPEAGIEFILDPSLGYRLLNLAVMPLLA
jgi:hypothetical protein